MIRKTDQLSKIGAQRPSKPAELSPDAATQALRRSQGDVGGAATALGVSPAQLGAALKTKAFEAALDEAVSLAVRAGGGSIEAAAEKVGLEPNAVLRRVQSRDGLAELRPLVESANDQFQVLDPKPRPQADATGKAARQHAQAAEQRALQASDPQEQIAEFTKALGFWLEAAAQEPSALSNRQGGAQRSALDVVRLLSKLVDDPDRSATLSVLDAALTGDLRGTEAALLDAGEPLTQAGSVDQAARILASVTAARDLSSLASEVRELVADGVIEAALTKISAAVDALPNRLVSADFALGLGALYVEALATSGELPARVGDAHSLVQRACEAVPMSMLDDARALVLLADIERGAGDPSMSRDLLGLALEAGVGDKTASWVARARLGGDDLRLALQQLRTTTDDPRVVALTFMAEAKATGDRAPLRQAKLALAAAARDNAAPAAVSGGHAQLTLGGRTKDPELAQLQQALKQLERGAEDAPSLDRLLRAIDAAPMADAAGVWLSRVLDDNWMKEPGVVSGSSGAWLALGGADLSRVARTPPSAFDASRPFASGLVDDLAARIGPARADGAPRDDDVAHALGLRVATALFGTVEAPAALPTLPPEIAARASDGADEIFALAAAAPEGGAAAALLDAGFRERPDGAFVSDRPELAGVVVQVEPWSMVAFGDSHPCAHVRVGGEATDAGGATRFVEQTKQTHVGEMVFSDKQWSRFEVGEQRVLERLANALHSKGGRRFLVENFTQAAQSLAADGDQLQDAVNPRALQLFRRLVSLGRGTDPTKAGATRLEKLERLSELHSVRDQIATTAARLKDAGALHGFQLEIGEENGAGKTTIGLMALDALAEAGFERSYYSPKAPSDGEKKWLGFYTKPHDELGSFDVANRRFRLLQAEDGSCVAIVDPRDVPMQEARPLTDGERGEILAAAATLAPSDVEVRVLDPKDHPFRRHIDHAAGAGGATLSDRTDAGYAAYVPGLQPRFFDDIKVIRGRFEASLLEAGVAQCSIQVNPGRHAATEDGTLFQDGTPGGEAIATYAERTTSTMGKREMRARLIKNLATVIEAHGGLKPELAESFRDAMVAGPGYADMESLHVGEGAADRAEAYAEQMSVDSAVPWFFVGSRDRHESRVAILQSVIAAMHRHVGLQADRAGAAGDVDEEARLRALLDAAD